LDVIPEWISLNCLSLVSSIIGYPSIITLIIAASFRVGIETSIISEIGEGSTYYIDTDCAFKALGFGNNGSCWG